MTRFSIAIANEQRGLRFDSRRIRRFVRSVLDMEHVAGAEISVAIVDDARIHAINREFLNHDCPTDVISFLLDGGESAAQTSPAGRARRGTLAGGAAGSSRPRGAIGAGESSRIIRRGAGKVIGGEIVISAETARRVAAEYAATPLDELALYLAHGLLHLCGYDDLTPKEKRLMRRREAEALAAWKA